MYQSFPNRKGGRLDHALANASLISQVTGAAAWHINADEPRALDYRAVNQPLLYQPDPFRSSDHDPILVGLALNAPPNCSLARPSVDTIWPPNHKFISIDVLGVTDPDGDEVVITVDSIFQDEPVEARGDGNFEPDGLGVGTGTAQLRAERTGFRNGRVYHIRFTADDGQGEACSGEILVGVPKSMGKKGGPIDEGSLFDSTVVMP